MVVYESAALSFSVGKTEVLADIRIDHKMIFYINFTFTNSSVIKNTMKLLISQEKLNQHKSRDLIPLECYECKQIFHKPKNEIQTVLKGNAKNKAQFCSIKCQSNFKNTQIECKCKYCDKTFFRTLKKTQKSKNQFCSNNCAAFYNNAHKTTGYSRSKLEKWLEIKLKKLFPDLSIIYNDRLTIGAELDIYIASLNLAFELNGPFHYQPIYGLDHLTEIQKRDKRKFALCEENGIEFCVIDTSTQKYFKEKTSMKYLDIITNIINRRLNK